MARPRTSWLMRLWTWLLWASIYGVFVLMSRSINFLRVQSRLNSSSLFANPFSLIACTILILLLTSAIHELGHLLGGWLAGLKLHTFVVGPLQWTQDEGVRLVGRNGFNGRTASLPTHTNNLKRQMLIFALGGPVASLLQVCLGVFVYWWTYSAYTPLMSGAWVNELGLITAVVSALFLLTTLRPGPYNNGMMADGGRILMLLRGGEQAEQWCALILLNRADLEGVRPRDWDADLVEKVTAVQDGTQDALTALLMGYAHALDTEQIDRAEMLLEEAMGLWVTWVGGARARVALEKAFFYGFARDDAQQAAHWLTDVRLRGQYGLLEGRAETAVVLAQGHAPKALQLAQQTIAQNPPQTGTAKAEHAWLRAMQTKAERLAHAE